MCPSVEHVHFERVHATTYLVKPCSVRLASLRAQESLNRIQARLWPFACRDLRIRSLDHRAVPVVATKTARDVG